MTKSIKCFLYPDTGVSGKGGVEDGYLTANDSLICTFYGLLEFSLSVKFTGGGFILLGSFVACHVAIGQMVNQQLAWLLVQGPVLSFVGVGFRLYLSVYFFAHVQQLQPVS